MSSLLRAIGRLLANLFRANPPVPEPDAMTPRDWADLPVHHPSCDGSPC